MRLRILRGIYEVREKRRAMNALELLKITRGAKLILNPGSEFGKELLLEEVKSIIDGSILRPRESYTVDRPT